LSTASLPTFCRHLYSRSFFLFFFQAEDGIRDFHVTGVQTCALPISIGLCEALATRTLDWSRVDLFQVDERAVPPDHEDSNARLRSEERRVGKECRSRGAPEHEKKRIGHERRTRVREEAEVEVGQHSR